MIRSSIDLHLRESALGSDSEPRNGQAMEPEPEPEQLPPLEDDAGPPQRTKATRITLQLCQEAIFGLDQLGLDDTKMMEQLFNTKILRLNDEAIGAIDDLEMFTALQRLYLHHNQIRAIENMEFHPALRLLSINNNLCGPLLPRPAPSRRLSL